MEGLWEDGETKAEMVEGRGGPWGVLRTWG